MRRNPHPSTHKNHARPTPEIYCRRDNLVYPVCPRAAAGHPCPCLHEVETADALFEIRPLDDEFGQSTDG